VGHLESRDVGVFEGGLGLVLQAENLIDHT